MVRDGVVRAGQGLLTTSLSWRASYAFASDLSEATFSRMLSSEIGSTRILLMRRPSISINGEAAILVVDAIRRPWECGRDA